MIRTDGKQSRAWGVPKGGGIFWKHLPRRVVPYLQELEDSGSGSVSGANQVPVVKASHYRMLSSMVMCGNVKIQRESTRQGRVSICQQGLWIKALAKNISKHKQASLGKEGKTGEAGRFGFLFASKALRKPQAAELQKKARAEAVST